MSEVAQSHSSEKDAAQGIDEEPLQPNKSLVPLPERAGSGNGSFFSWIFRILHAREMAILCAMTSPTHYLMMKV